MLLGVLALAVASEHFPSNMVDIPTFCNLLPLPFPFCHLVPPCCPDMRMTQNPFQDLTFQGDRWLLNGLLCSDCKDLCLPSTDCHAPPSTGTVQRFGHV